MIEQIRWSATYVLLQFALTIMPKDKRGKELLVAIYPWLEQESQFAKNKLEQLKAKR